MTSIITGDIINSRKVSKPGIWLTPLKKLLGTFGKTPQQWEIYRGDSFQVEISSPENALLAAMRIKATIKCIKGLDVRLAIGIGAKEHPASTITQSSGEAFILSGEKLEALKKEKQTLAVQTRWAEFDHEINLYLRLALIAMDSWSQGAAELVKVCLENPEKSQAELGEILGISQSSVSERQKRARYSEIAEMELLYRDKIIKLISK